MPETRMLNDRLWAKLLLALFPSALALALYHHLTTLGFTGVDAPTWVSQARGDALSGFKWCFCERHFIGYRPLTALSYAIGSRFHGFDAQGYQIFDLGLFAVLVWSVYWICRVFEIPRGASCLGASIMALHPLALEVVPVLARRGDQIATLLSVFAVGHFWRGRFKIAALLTLAALASKETSFALLPVLAIAVALVPAERRGTAIRGWLLCVASVPIMFACRFGALGEWLGGYPKVENVSGTSIVVDTLTGLSSPYPGAFVESVSSGEALSLGPMALVILSVLALVIVVLLGRKGSPAIWTLGIVWWGTQTALFVVSHKWELRLLFPALPAIGFWTAAFTANPSKRFRFVGWSALGLLVAIWSFQGPLIQGLGEWEEASNLQRALIESCDECLATDSKTELILIANHPLGLWARTSSRRVSLMKREFGLRDYTAVISPSGLRELLLLHYPSSSFERLIVLNNIIFFDEGVELKSRVVGGPDDVLVTQNVGKYLSTMDAALTANGRPGAPMEPVELVYDRQQRARLVVFKGAKGSEQLHFQGRLRVLFLQDGS